MEHNHQPEQGPATPPEAADVEAATTPDIPEQDQSPQLQPKVYIASLADYNDGRLHGEWIDATQEPDDIRQQIHAMLSQSPSLQRQGEDFGDWAIHDYEDFGVATVHENDDIETVHALAAGIAEHGEAFAAWADVNDYDKERWTQFQEAFLGSFDSLAAYGQQFIDDMGWQADIDQALPEPVARYAQVDADALAQDMWLSGEIQIVRNPDGGVWIFRGDV